MNQLEINKENLRKAVEFMRDMQINHSNNQHSQVQDSFDKGLFAGAEMAYKIAADHLERMFNLEGGE